MEVLELFNRIKEQISEEDYNELYELVTNLRDTLEETKQQVDWLENDNDELQNHVECLEADINSLESQLEHKPSSNLCDLVDEILKEDLWKYNYRKYDTYEKIIEALDHVER